MAAWRNQKLIVYHGTYDGALSSPISLARCRPATDFGQGFYTTTNLHQAKQWANERVRGRAAKGSSVPAAVYRFELDRNDLANCDWLGFARPTQDFWSFVTACRSGAPDHSRLSGAAPIGPAKYDIVLGPVTLWPQRLIIGDCDQISFHTSAVSTLLTPIFHDKASPGRYFK